MSELDKWRDAGEHLPEFMRDFHDQKDLFKALFEVVGERNESLDGGQMRDLNWIASHVYTIDVFLWVMAAHGWTLQRSRKPVEFGDIEKFVSDAREARRQQAVSIFKGVIGQ